MKKGINTDIAVTYTITSRKQTFVAVLGVLLGMSVYIFMNSMNNGFDRSANAAFFKSTPHIRLYKDDVLSEPLNKDSAVTTIIINPKIVPSSKKMNDPASIVAQLRADKEVALVLPQVSVSGFYSIGESQISGRIIGLRPEAGDSMFDISSFMVQGQFKDLSKSANGVVIGSGIAAKFNVESGDRISFLSSKGVTESLEIVGIFETSNAAEDKSKAYVNLSKAQQLMRESSSYVSDININLVDYKRATLKADEITKIIGYKAEGWEQAFSSYVAGSRMRTIVITFVSLTLLLVSCFGIYNILNMTVSQKINDIAILKAMGFNGADVIRIFVTQAMIVGILGVIGGVLLALVVVNLMKHVYIGGDIGYFPIQFELYEFAKGITIGLFITFLAGYIPARKAAKVDPVTIFRK
jgi:lipoprotein-releasing system permease protein